MMKIFIDEQLYKLFADINATNNAISTSRARVKT